MPNRRQALQWGAGALVAGFGSPLRADPPRPLANGIVKYGAARRYEVEQRITITNGELDLSSIEFWIPVPQNLPEQSVTGLKIEPETPVVVDTTGQAAVGKLVLSDSLPGKGESVELKATYQITCRSRSANLRALASYPFREYTRDKRYETFLRPEKYVQVSDERIVKLAQRFAGTRRPAPQIAKDIFDYVLDHTDYQLIDKFGGANYCLENGHGECADYSALFVALCRAAGVPACPVSGFWADETNGWHCWAEFMLPSGEWVPVDPQVGDRSAYNRRLYFGSIDNRRVALCKTHDIRLPESDVGHHEADFLQTGHWWWRTDRLVEGVRYPEAVFYVRGRRAG
jgi:hypothetical protein